MTHIRFLIVSVIIVVAAASGLFLVQELFRTDTPVADLRKGQAMIVLTSSGFEPREARVLVGQTVTFTTTLPRDFWPASNPHPAHSIYGAFDPGVPISADSSWSFVLDKEGVWGYHDHVRSYFTGILYVEPE